MIGYEAIKWVLGIELSVMDTGAYTLIATLAVFAGATVRSIANVLVPVASRFDALKRHDKNTTLALLGTKYVMIVSGFMCLTPLFLLKPFLVLWIGDEYPVQYMSKLALAGMILLLGQWFITVAVCILQMLIGIGKIQFPAKVTIIWAVGGLGGVWIYLHWIGNSLLVAVIGIAAARAIGSVAHLIYGMTVFRLKSKEFLFGAILRPGLVGMTVCALSMVMMNHWDVYKIKEFTLTVILLFTIYAVATWTITLSSAERCAVLAALRPIANKMRSA
jgi:O-antigen/teichoic acid export membrane protein